MSAVIVLGDTGANYWGETDWRDRNLKKKMNESGNIFYLVRGNHEFRPQELSTIQSRYDENVEGFIMIEPEFPNIRYFEDFGIYKIGSWIVGVIGGSYSVDKFHRLQNGWNWFEDEQLNDKEKEECYELFSSMDKIDLILCHTCPYRYEPTDLFLPMVDQSQVDKSMEHFLDQVYTIHPRARWCWGHYHDDRIVDYRHRMFYKDIATLAEVMGTTD